MKFAAIRDLQIKASAVVKDAQREPVVITVHGKPQAVLTSITEGALEEFLFEHSPKLRRRIEEGLRDIKAGRAVSHADLKSRLHFKLRRARRAAR